MNKTIKVLLFILMFGLLVVSFSYATDINMDLQPNVVSGNTTSSVTSTENNINANVTNQGTTTNTITSSTPQNSVLSDTQSTTVKTVSSTQNESLSLTSILNILLIVVGVVLILLGIAILIRMHS